MNTPIGFDPTETFSAVAALTPTALVQNTERLARQNHRVTATLLVHLAALDERQTFVGLGYRSLFDFATRRLNFSEAAAGKRIHAARAIKAFPHLVALIASGQLHLAAVCLLAPHLAQNPTVADELIGSACGKSKRDVEAMLIAKFPLAAAAQKQAVKGKSQLVPVPAVIAPIAAMSAGPLFAMMPAEQHPVASDQESAPALCDDPISAELPTCNTPASPEVPTIAYALRTQLDAQTHADLLQLQNLVGREIDARDLSGVIAYAIKTCLAVAQKKRGLLEPQKPAKVVAVKSPATPSGRGLPVAVRRAVYERDQAACTFVGTDGVQCGSRQFIEFHHCQAFALGGAHSVENITLRCRTHNLEDAVRDFGLARMARFAPHLKTRVSLFAPCLS